MRKKDKIGIIEKLGQKIPDPVIIFILLYILVLIVTNPPIITSITVDASIK